MVVVGRRFRCAASRRRRDPTRTLQKTPYLHLDVNASIQNFPLATVLMSTRECRDRGGGDGEAA